MCILGKSPSEPLVRILSYCLGEILSSRKRINLVEGAFLVDLRLSLWFAFYRTV
jgi:hypothetical protein